MIGLLLAAAMSISWTLQPCACIETINQINLPFRGKGLGDVGYGFLTPGKLASASSGKGASWSALPWVCSVSARKRGLFRACVCVWPSLFCRELREVCLKRDLLPILLHGLFGAECGRARNSWIWNGRYNKLNRKIREEREEIEFPRLEPSERERIHETQLAIMAGLLVGCHRGSVY